MATLSTSVAGERSKRDYLTGTPRAHGLDRWIFVISAALYIVIVLIGFIPDSLAKVAMVKAGLRPPFPLILHVHAVAMGSFLLFLLAQTVLVATGRTALHRKIGPAGGLLAVILVVVGFLLAPAMYHQVSGAIPAAAGPAQEQLQAMLGRLDDILLLQISAGILFPLFIGLGLSMRVRDPGFHKRMMIIAPAMAIGAAFARINWIPQTTPATPTSIEVYQLLSLAPLFVWDVLRNRRIHRAYLVLALLYVPMTLIVRGLWDTPWWHETARRIMGV